MQILGTLQTEKFAVRDALNNLKKSGEVSAGDMVCAEALHGRSRLSREDLGA